MASLLSELRRRNVPRVAAAYALVAWIFIEAGSVLLPEFGAPDWFFRVYIMLVSAGFVAALVFAWIYEITPEGVKLDRDVDDAARARPKRGFNVAIITLLVIALGVSISFNISGIRKNPAGPVAASGRHSIAVLPFESRSSDPDNVFFADGIHDDLLARLADVESLRVISRTSVMKYRETDRNIRQIAEDLDVDVVVEGAVQRAGDRVRITVQLIDAATDKHIWAEVYDQDMTLSNIFTIQSEVSSQIMRNLRAQLTTEDEARLAAIPTTSMEAYTMYAAGRQNLWQRSFESLNDARRQFEQAIKLDTDYAEAYAGLAETVMILMINHSALLPDVAFATAQQAVDTAMALDPRLAEAHAVHGLIQAQRWLDTRQGDGNLRAARAYQQALSLKPNHVYAWIWFASLREAEERYDEAIGHIQQALEIDPLARIPYVNLAGIFAKKGDHEAAVSILLRAIDLFPEWASVYGHLTTQLEGEGRLDEAVAWIRYSEPFTEDPLHFGQVLKLYSEFGQTDRIIEFGRGFPEDHPLYPIGRSYILALLGDYADAQRALLEASERAEIQHPFTYPILIATAIMLEDYAGARRWLLEMAPDLASDAPITVNRRNVHDVVMLGFLDSRLGRDRESEAMLTGALAEIDTLPRFGAAGHGILDVRVLAALGRITDALDALEAATAAGFVGYRTQSLWTIDDDPLIAPLRAQPRFEAVRQELDERIDALGRNVEIAEQSGDWTPLLRKVYERTGMQFVHAAN